MEVRSTLSMNTLLSSRMSATQAQIQTLQRQVATGQRAETYAQLGTQAGANIALHNEASTVATFQQNNQVLIGRMSAMDQAMTAMHDPAESVKSDAYALMPSDTQRNALILSAQNAFSTVVNALQTSVGGRALFSGDGTDVTPIVSTVFSDLQSAITALPQPVDTTAVESTIDNFFSTPSNFYQGGSSLQPSAVDKNISVDYGILASDPAFKDLLQGLATIALMPTPDGVNITDAQYTAAIQGAASTLSQGVGQLNQLISSNGSNQALVENTNTQHATTLTMVQEQINTIEQTDLAEAASQLAQLSTQLQATYEMTAQLNQLSLINYLS